MPGLHLEQVSFAYHRTQPVLREVSAHLHAGIVTAILGPNAAGKTTLLRLLAGIAQPSSGTVRLDELDLADMTPRVRASRMGYVSQRPSLGSAFSLREYVRLGLFARRPDPGAVADAIVRVDLADQAERPFSTLSVGQQQRAAVARALVQLGSAPAHGAGTQAFLADEPCSAMDPRHASRTVSLLRDQARAGRVVVVTLHDMTLAMRIADRAILLNDQGRIAADGPVNETLSPERLEQIFGIAFRHLTDPTDPEHRIVVPAIHVSGRPDAASADRVMS